MKLVLAQTATEQNALIGERFGYLQVKDGALEVNPAVAELIQNTIQNYTGEPQ